MKNTLIALVVIAAVAGILINTQSQKETNEAAIMVKNEVPQAIPKNEVFIDGNPTPEAPLLLEKEAMEKDEVIGKKSGSFVNLNDVDIASTSGNIVLDFSATWCPSCRTFKADVEEKLDVIPSNLTLIVVDYDSNVELKKRYGVTQQHTFVQIDNQGNLIQKWSGGSTLESVVSRIK